MCLCPVYVLINEESRLDMFPVNNTCPPLALCVTTEAFCSSMWLPTFQGLHRQLPLMSTWYCCNSTTPLRLASLTTKSALSTIPSEARAAQCSSDVSRPWILRHVGRRFWRQKKDVALVRTFRTRLSGSRSKSGERRGPGRCGDGCDMARGLVSVAVKVLS